MTGGECDVGFTDAGDIGLTAGLLDAVQDIFYVCDTDGTVVNYNDRASEVSGYAPGEIESMKAWEFFPESEREQIVDKMRSIVEDGEKIRTEGHFLTDDGETIPYEFTGSPLCDRSGDVVGFAGTGRDIRERKERERELTRQRDNLELLDQMVRHDLRNHLQVVSGHAEALADHVDDEGQAYIEQILQSIVTATELTESARDLAEVVLHRADADETFTLGRVIERQVTEVRTESREASITVDRPLPDSRVVGDEMLPSIFRNLLQNAVQHNDKQVPKVAVSATERDETARVRIADNGPGIPDERKGEIFGKGEMGLESDGTGIGLYLVETLVESYGGSVRVEDRASLTDTLLQADDSEGAVFVVELPQAD